MVLDGRRADARISGETFRFAMGLRSEWLRFTAKAKQSVHEPR
jgi:hypothetical protein